MPGSFTDSNSFLIGMIAGAIGSGYFLYGKKQDKPVPMVCGVLLITYPYLTDNILILLAVGVALCVAPYFIRT
jgi:hypothetical protein